VGNKAEKENGEAMEEEGEDEENKRKIIRHTGIQTEKGRLSVG
jgi:hypothetical protein